MWRDMKREMSNIKSRAVTPSRAFDAALMSKCAAVPAAGCGRNGSSGRKRPWIRGGSYAMCRPGIRVVPSSRFLTRCSPHPLEFRHNGKQRLENGTIDTRWARTRPCLAAAVGRHVPSTGRRTRAHVCGVCWEPDSAPRVDNLPWLLRCRNLHHRHIHGS